MSREHVIWNTYHKGDHHIYWYELMGIHFVETFKNEETIERKRFDSYHKASMYFEEEHYKYYCKGE